jgi:hypothetical protein
MPIAGPSKIFALESTGKISALLSVDSFSNYQGRSAEPTQ